MTYKILGADHKEYGPVTKEQLIIWINEGRANGATVAQVEGSVEWKPLADFPEFAEVLRTRATTPPPFSPGVPPGPAPTEQLLLRDYRLDIGGCVSRAYALLRDKFGLIFGVSAVFLILQVILGVFGAIPIIGPLFSIGNLIITGPLTGGLYFVFLRAIRGQPAEVGDLFAGFRNRFGQLLLGYVVPALLSAVVALPGVIAIVVGVVAIHKESLVLGIPLVIVGLVLALIPAVYLGVSWVFTLPLVLDKQLDFWQAMQVSRKTVGKHFFIVLGLLIVTALINFCGILFCGIGLFFTLPISFGTLMYAYETIFSTVEPAATTPPGTLI